MPAFFYELFWYPTVVTLIILCCVAHFYFRLFIRPVSIRPLRFTFYLFFAFMYLLIVLLFPKRMNADEKCSTEIEKVEVCDATMPMRGEQFGSIKN